MAAIAERRHQESSHKKEMAGGTASPAAAAEASLLLQVRQSRHHIHNVHAIRRFHAFIPLLTSMFHDAMLLIYRIAIAVLRYHCFSICRRGCSLPTRTGTTSQGRVLSCCGGAMTAPAQA